MNADLKTSLIEALATILDQIEIEDEKHYQRTKGREIRPVPIQEVLDRPDVMKDYIEAPTARALRAGVRDFGLRLFKIADYADCHDIAEDAAALRGNEGWRADVVDKRWNGLVSRDGATWVA